MRRGQKPAKSKEAKTPVARKSPKDDGAKVRDLEKRLAEALRDKAEALEQQTATAEILRIIGSSPADAQPVFDAIAVNALRLCDANAAVVVRYDGERLHLAAHHNVDREGIDRLKRHYPRTADRDLPVGRAVLDSGVVHVPDLQEAVEFSGSVARQRGVRSQIAIPLLHQGRAIGAIGISRLKFGPFSEQQIALLQTFAAQAVIAIENVRLFNETKEALEQQTATSQILRVIASSPTDVQPVFDAIVESAARLCDGVFSTLHTFDGELMHLVAAHNWTPAAFEAARRIWPARPSQATVTGRAIVECTAIHVPDTEQVDRQYQTQTQGLVAAIGLRSVLAVPMLRNGAALGVIAVGRAEPGPFSDSQIALLKTFADQAVIAIENVRLFKELQASNHELTESLAQQTATAEILRVISSSPTDLQPVFDTVVRNAVMLCSAALGGLHRIKSGQITLDAHYGFGEELATILKRDVFPLAISRASVTGRAILERGVVHIRDIREDREYGAPLIQTMPSFRTILAVPMLREGAPVGVLALWRSEVQPFTEAEIGLVQTFAHQAVIAIENVRLFTELQEKNRALTKAHAQVSESLDQQTATSEILRVISQSPTDVQPVFDTIVGRARHLLNGFSAIVTRLVADQLHLAAFTRTTEAADALMTRAFPMPLAHGSLSAEVVRGGVPSFASDIETDERFDAGRRDVARARGYRSIVHVPMLVEGRAIGTIAVTRRETGPFLPGEIALLQTFADQAVIAIENVRLFNETKEALERQTATSEILRVISSSPTDAKPVFEAIARNAALLCDASRSAVSLLEGDWIRFVALYNFPEGWTRMHVADAPNATRVMRDGVIFHVADVETDARVTPEALSRTRALGARSFLMVPLHQETAPIGGIVVYRSEAGSFSEEQIELLKTFADQAVIAIENVRLFTELQASNRELTTALDTQTATSDILRVISRSPTDVQPVFDAIVASAVRLLRAHTGALTRIAGDQIEIATLTSADEAGDAALRARFPQSLHSEDPHAQVIRARAPLNFADAQTDPRWPEAARAYARVRGYRSAVVVPMLRHNEVIGSIGVNRREPGGFTDDEIVLLQTFADQAVIAIENARLLTELQARTQELSRSVEQLTALGEVGRAVSSSLDLETVLTTIVSRAVQLSGLDGGVVFEYDAAAEEFAQRAAIEPAGALAEARRTARIRRGEGVVGRTAVTLGPAQVPDITVAGAYEGQLREILIEAGVRAVLAVPMLREGQLLGCLAVTRNAPGDFPPATMELLRTFATQSALAIQNARLFLEIADKSHQLEVASQHKSEFLANMSHELRTPLNAIIGFSEVLAEKMFGELNEKQEEYSKDIHASGQHLLSLINDILDLSKIEAGRMELELTDFDLPTAIDNALTLVRERAARRGITLEKVVDPRLGQMRADERKVRQVVLNLLSNAIKFTPEGGRIEVTATPKDGSIEVSVSDTGIGIAPEDQEAVFEEFRQVGMADKKVEGTGLGLTLCRKFVELHGGRIWVKSQVGVGSTFTFTVPVRHGE